MDIFAHGLWAAAGARAANGKSQPRVSVGWTAWWGVFPDLFAFTIPVTLRTWERLANPGPAPHGMPHMPLAWQLYHFSHSLIIFSAVFGLVWLVKRRPPLVTLGWLLHVLIDIPTHTLRFFPTPFLWPISDYVFSGISWGNRWFLLCNYSALAIVYILLWRNNRKCSETSFSQP